MAFKNHDFLLAIIAIVVGTIIGELINIEFFLDKLAKFFQQRVKNEYGNFTLAFVTASVLFCVGSMTIIGAINDGLNGDSSVLYIKSLLDGISSIILASTLGIGVIFSVIVILVYQGLLSFLAFNFTFLINDKIYINGISVVGGIIILGIGLDMLGLIKIKTGNMLPSLFIVPIVDFIAKLI